MTCPKRELVNSVPVRLSVTVLRVTMEIKVLYSIETRGIMKNLHAMLLTFASLAVATAQNTPADYDEVLKILGKQGDFKMGVLKVNIPRGDLKVTIDGIATPTP